METLRRFVIVLFQKYEIINRTPLYTLQLLDETDETRLLEQIHLTWAVRSGKSLPHSSPTVRYEYVSAAMRFGKGLGVPS